MATLLRIWVVILAALPFLFGGAAQAQSGGEGSDRTFELRWSPDGRWISVGSSNGVWIFDALDFEAAPYYYAGGDGYESRVYAAVFDPLRPQIAFVQGDEEQVRVIDLESGDLIFTAPISRFPDDFSAVVYDLAYTPDGERLIVLNTANLYVLDAQTGVQLFEFSYPDPASNTDGWLTSVDFAADGRIVVGNWGGAVIQISPEGRSARTDVNPGADFFGVERLEVDPNGNDALILYFNQLYRYDLASLNNIRPLFFEGLDAEVTAFTFSPDGSRLAVGSLGRWMVFDWAALQRVLDIDSPAREGDFFEGRIHSMAYNPDGTRLATLQTDGQFIIWDAQTGERIVSLGSFVGGVNQRWG